MDDGLRRELLNVRIDTDYSNPARPYQVGVDVLTTNAYAQAALDSIDMNAARREMEAAIAGSIQRRRSR